MKLSNTALRELSAKYKDILKKCAIFNAAILMGVMVAAPAGAVDYTSRQVVPAGETGTFTADDTFKNLAGDQAGAAIYSEGGTVNVTGTLFKDNKLPLTNVNLEGGAIRTLEATLTVDGATFDGNESGRGGAISARSGTTTITDSIFRNNVGGKMASTINIGTSSGATTLTLTGNTFENNGSDEKKKSVISVNASASEDAQVIVSGNTFSNNKSDDEGVFNVQPGNANASTKVLFDGKNTFDTNTGSAIFIWNDVDVTFADGSVTEILSGTSNLNNNSGAGISNAGVMTFKSGSAVEFTENTATTAGGAIYNAGTLTMEDGASATFTGNKAVNGGAIYNKGTMTVTDSAFTGNKATSTGGAIRNEGTLTINESDFTGNVVQGKTVYGGALWNSGTLKVSNTDFKGNKALYPDDPSEIESWRDKRAYSSVLYNSEGTASFTDVNFIGNSGDYMGGVIQNAGGTLNLTRTLFEGNNDRDGKGTTSGASVLLTNAGTMNLADTTFRANLGAGAEDTDEGIVNAQGAAIVNFSGTTTFEDNKATALGLNAYDNPVVKFVENGTNSFIGNEAKDGAAIKNYNHVSYPEDRGTVLFEAGTENIFSGNKATNNGGAIYNTADIYFDGGINTFKNNTAGGEGGAIYNAVGASLDLYGTTVFSGNKAGGVANDIFNAGELYIGGDITLEGGIIGNGAVYFDDNTTLTGKLLNSATPLIDVGSLTVGENVEAYFTFDIGDVESETWKYAQADEWEGNDFVLSLDPNPLYDVVAGEEKGTITVSRRPTQDIVDDMTEAGASENEASAMAAVAGVNNTGDEVVDSIISSMKELIQEGKVEEAKELAGKINPTEAPVRQIVSATTAIMGAVSNRMAVVGSTPAPAVGRSGGDWNDDNSPNPITNLSPWIQGLYNKTHNSQGLGFDAYSKGFAFGADTRLNDAWTIGLGYAYTATDIKNSQRKMQVYGDNYFVYGQYKPSNWYVSAIASMGKADYKDKSVLTSTYDVDSYGGQLLAGYQKGLFDNYAGFRYTLIKSEAYDNGLTEVKAKNTQVGTAIIGTKVSKDFTCKKGVTWTPEFRLAGSYDVMSKASKATVGIIGSTSTYSVTGERLSRAALETGVSLKAKVKDFELVGGYDVELRSQNNTQAVNLKAIYHF